MINLISMEEIFALPEGVRKIEIENWTKTREVEDIGDGEKKLNSEEFEGIENINIDENNIEILYNLFDGLKMMRTPKTVYLKNKEKYSDLITGNKVLRIRNGTKDTINGFKYNIIDSWIGSDTNAIWKEGEFGSKIITWKPYVKVISNNKNAGTPIEWRMLKGKFYLSDEDIKLINSKQVQPVIGIETNDKDEFKLICPFNDLMSIFINGKRTSINYKTVREDCSYIIKSNYIDESENDLVNYINANLNGNEKYCDREKDNILSQHTNCKHLDTNILSKNYESYYYKMIGDISKYIKKTTNEYTISLLIGQMAREVGNIPYYGGGISKLNLYLIENPKFDIKIKPYKIKDDKKVYIDSDVKLLSGEEILFDVEISNLSTYYDFKDLECEINLIEKVISTISSEKSVLKINKNSITYKNEDITDSVKVYVNDENNPISLEDLSCLKKNDKLIISGDKLNYTVTDYNVNNERLDHDYVLEFKYLNDYTYYKYNNKDKIEFKPTGGTLNVKVDSNSSDYFYLKLTSEDNYANIKIKGNKTYTISNLDYDKEYKISLINSLSYEPENSQIFTLKNSSGYKTKSITISTNQKPNNYFTQRKIDEITINR